MTAPLRSMALAYGEGATTVHLSLSDNQTVEQSKEWISSQISIPTQPNQQIADIELNALRHLQGLVAAEIDRLEGLQFGRTR